MVDSKWQEFEHLIEKIQRETAPNAIVQHDHKVVGKSGRRRQLDITLTQKVGLQRVFIVIECKHYNKPLGIEKVEAFVTKLRDVGASQGVMISNAGFDAGAKATAREYFIALLSYREAQEVDWENVIGSESWLRLTLTQTVEVSIKAWCLDQLELEITNDEELYNQDGDVTLLANELVETVLEESRSLIPIGSFTAEMQIDQPLFFSSEGQFRRVLKLVVNGVNRTREYSVNLGLAFGHILRNDLTEEQVFQQFTTKSFDWANLISSQSGREVTEEEYQAMLESEGYQGALSLSNANRYLRLVASKSS